MRRIQHLALIGIFCACSNVYSLPAVATTVEPPFLQAAVNSGKLPPIHKRLPENPNVANLKEPYQSVGKYGGELRMLMGKTKDIRMMVVYGYARLVGYNRKLELTPDILEKLENQDNRVFTLHLRKGHRWSDGHPFTTEDFRYYWEDVANNKAISRHGPTQVLIVDGHAPKVEILSETAIRYSWSQPNPFFVAALAGPRPLFIYAPAHYLKQFHASYTDSKKLEKMVKAMGVRNWAGLHQRRNHLYKFDNPDLPTLQPWTNTTPPPADRYIFERNPYFHRTDPKGNQLPYIDRVLISIGSNSLIAAKTGAGESDLQGRYLRMDNYTFLKATEARNNYSVYLWKRVNGAQQALYPNLNSNDKVWRKLTHDVRFRRALSLAIDRHEINQIIYFGLVNESNNTVLPQSLLYKKKYQSRWANFDLKQANALLDDIGLKQRDDRGIRIMSDGRPLEIILQTAGESTEETDILELIHDNWLRIGVKLYTKPSQREVFRNRVFAGDAMMSIWTGLENGIPTPGMSPKALAPTSQQQLHWSKWGKHHETRHESGEAPSLPEANKLLELNQQWLTASTEQKRAQIWHQMLDIHSEQVFTIGIVNSVRQPIVVNNRLRNLPKQGVFSWQPSAYFGIYRPETFWFDETGKNN
ncbi:ABC transporter substrate-binding protein [Pseudomonadota bacterium]